MNVLITAAGRRVSVVKAFMAAVHERGGRVLAGDVDPLAPALYVADDVRRIPRADDPGYVMSLLDMVRADGIGLLVPMIDTDLPILAAAAEAFANAGCLAAVSTPDFTAVAGDKYLTGEAAGEAGVAVPATWLPPIENIAELPDELFVKPRQGSASRDTYSVPRSELTAILERVRDPVVQEVLHGREVTIDALLDFAGRPIHYVPRARLKTIGGESVEGVTLDHDPSLEAWLERLLEVLGTLGGRGPLTIQAFLTTRGPVLSEVNARFGGGFPLAHAAGAAYPAWLLDMAAGQSVEPRLRAYEPGLYMTRYNVEHFTRHLPW